MKKTIKTSNKLLIAAGIFLAVSMLVTVIAVRVVFDRELLPYMQGSSLEYSEIISG